MRIEEQRGRLVLCGGILSVDKIKPGQQWVGSSGGVVTVKEVDAFGWVKYEWEEGGAVKEHEKDAFAFQCRYCLIVEPGQTVDQFE